MKYEKKCLEDSFLPLHEVVEGQDDSDGQQEDGRGVGDDGEGGDDAQEAGDPATKDHRHRRVENVNVFAESVQNSAKESFS